MIVDRYGYRFRIHEPSELRTDEDLIEEIIVKQTYGKGFGGIIVDIGANIGVFTCMAAREAFHVYAYEPVKENFDLLVENVKLNGLKNATCVNKAVLDRSGQLEMDVSTVNFGSGSFYKGSLEKKQTVDCITLKQLFAEHELDHCDVLKLDCEGAEYEILESSMDLIQRGGVKRIVMEVHSEYIPGCDQIRMAELIEQTGLRGGCYIVDTMK